jgi:hypothetical protein
VTTPRPAHAGHPSEVAGAEGLGMAVLATDDPDRETLTRVLDGLRDLPQQPRPRRSPDASTGAAGTSALPLPRRR